MFSPLRKKLPDFPWDALAPYGVKARKHPDGIIDLSQGTPVDPTPDFIQKVLAENSNSPGYQPLQERPNYRRRFVPGHVNILQ